MRELPFGDESKIIVPDEPIDCSDEEFFDELDYDCWNFVRVYCSRLGIRVKGEISFDIAKEIQNCIIEQLEKSGVKFKFD